MLNLILPGIRHGDLVFAFTFSSWIHPNSNHCDRDQWAKTRSPNKDVKVYLGAPASRGAAGNGYVSSQDLINVVRASQKKYSSFGGVMLWDADSAYSKSPHFIALTRKFPS